MFLSQLTWLKKLSNGGGRCATIRNRFTRLGVEVLEDRTVPTVLTSPFSGSVIHDHLLTVASSAGLLQNDMTDTGNALSVASVNGNAAAIGQTITLPIGAGLTMQANGSFIFSPASNSAYTDSFIVSVADGVSFADETVTISVTNATPTLTGQSFSGNHDQVLRDIDVLGGASDADGDAVQAIIVGGPNHGQLTPVVDGLYDYTPDPNWTGTDTFIVAATDGIAASMPATMTVNVTDTAPTATGQTFWVSNNQTLSSIDLSMYLNDPDGDPLQASIVNQPMNGQVTTNADGTYAYTPNPQFVGIDMFSFKGNDGVADSNPGFIMINVANASPSDVIVQNFGTGSVSLTWDQQSSATNLAPMQSLDIPGTVTGLSAKLLTSDADYELSTNGTFASLKADTGVTGVHLSVDTTPTFVFGWSGNGDIGVINMPGGDPLFGPSTLSVMSRHDVGTVSGTSDGAGVLGGTLQFANLDGSITGLDSITQINATGWLGADTSSVMCVNHGIGTLQAEGVRASINTNLLFDTTDVNSTVTIGNGGILQTVSLGNVGSFTDSGNINEIDIVSLNGVFALNGAVTVDQLVLAQAQNADVRARQSTIRTLRSMPGGSPGLSADIPNFGMNSLTVDAIDYFLLGTDSAAARVVVRGDMRVRHIGEMHLLGRLQARNIIISGSIGEYFYVTGVAGNVPDDRFAIRVQGTFDINRIEEPNGFSSIWTQRTIYAPRFIVRQGRIDQLSVAGYTSDEKSFYGSIRVLQGGIHILAVRDTLAQADPGLVNWVGGLPFAAFVPNTVLVQANSEIDYIGAHIIGSDARRNFDAISAPSIGRVIAVPYTVFTQQFFNPNRIYAQIRATNGGIDKVDATGGEIWGEIFARGGDIKDVETGSLFANVISQRNRDNLTDNIGGNIWQINAPGAIGLDVGLGSSVGPILIRADNSIADITAGSIANNVIIMLQQGGTLTTDENEDLQFTMGGGSLNVDVTRTGFVFAPTAVVFTYGLSSASNPFDANLNVPAVWKLAWGGAQKIMNIQDNPASGPRNIGWYLFYGSSQSDVYASFVAFSGLFGDNTVDLLVDLLDGNPSGASIFSEPG